MMALRGLMTEGTGRLAALALRATPDVRAVAARIAVLA